MVKPQFFVFFCEDSRDEVGNKLSLMGLLGPKVVLSPSEKFLPNLTIGAMCLFFEPEPVEVQFEIKFIAADSDVPQLPPPEPMSMRLEPPGEEAVWSSNIIGKFHGLPIHNGMVIEATLKCLGQEISSTLTVDQRAS